MEDKNFWPDNPADFCMIKFHCTGDDEYDNQVHKEANEEHIKLLLCEKAITHPNQLPWYDPNVFHVHPSFYAHHKNKWDNKGENDRDHLCVSVFSENEDDFMPNVLPSRNSNSGEYLFSSSISNIKRKDHNNSLDQDDASNSDNKPKTEDLHDLQLLNDTLMN
jgi:hypothetical protein